MSKKLTMGMLMIILVLGGVSVPQGLAESSFDKNSVVPNTDSGMDRYEIAVGRKLQRGLQNFFLSWLEVPHGVKSEFYYRKQEYLPAGLETFCLGLFKGVCHGFGRAAVGLYEGFTCVFPQDPILPEMDEWLY